MPTDLSLLKSELQSISSRTFFSGESVSVLLHGEGFTRVVEIDVVAIAWNESQPVMPHYDHDSAFFSGVSYGGTIVQGEVSMYRTIEHIDPLYDAIRAARGIVRGLGPTTSVALLTSSDPRGQSPLVTTPLTPTTLPRGPFRITTVFVHPESRQFVGCTILDGVYFTGSSPAMAAGSPDPLTCAYPFLARSITRPKPGSAA